MKSFDFLLISYENMMNNFYEIVQDLRDIKYDILLLRGAPVHDITNLLREGQLCFKKC